MSKLSGLTAGDVRLWLGPAQELRVWTPFTGPSQSPGALGQILLSAALWRAEAAWKLREEVAEGGGQGSVLECDDSQP